MKRLLIWLHRKYGWGGCKYAIKDVVNLEKTPQCIHCKKYLS